MTYPIDGFGRGTWAAQFNSFSLSLSFASVIVYSLPPGKSGLPLESGDSERAEIVQFCQELGEQMS